jgi:hypothetical protein
VLVETQDDGKTKGHEIKVNKKVKQMGQSKIATTNSK